MKLINPSPYELRYDISVIILTYNQPLTLQLSLHSLLHQRLNGTYEVIVSDDGSSADVFKGIRDQFDAAAIPIRYIWQQDRSIRTGQARNNGIKMAQGRIVLFLDGDIVPSLDLLEQHIAAHAQPKRLVAGNRQWRSIDNDAILRLPIEEALQQLEYQTGIDEQIVTRERNEKAAREEMRVSATPWRVCFTCHLSVQKSDVVFFDENMIGWGVEDWEFSYRLCTQLDYIPIYDESLITYQVEVPGIFSNVFRRNKHDEIVMYMRNVLYFADKYPDFDVVNQIAFGFSRFFLNETLQKWEVRPRPTSYDLEVIVESARKWLSDSGLYDKGMHQHK